MTAVSFDILKAAREFEAAGLKSHIYRAMLLQAFAIAGIKLIP